MKLLKDLLELAEAMENSEVQDPREIESEEVKDLEDNGDEVK